ncbi:RagB/SusD family nutrient uptake outer membrane protein [uncultured Polaribacter sp.]|uniref:RagB/SusD family nutrient uptake outer membrane protein n=1 Tax=uncultured Polaribacter sp. TaxID=174711 RepID=UPI00262F2930|nr:RagB/SusD family nutrient uptake outer membrane protein [uncultured Polaribacter sp.]
MMKNIKLIYIRIIILSLVFSSCEAMLEPDEDNRRSSDILLTDPTYGEGILLNAYNALESYRFDEAATDDAVNNNTGNAFSRMALGEWAALYNPQSRWDYAYEQLYYINKMLEIVADVEWSYKSKERNDLFLQKHTGEAYGLRAVYNFMLLQSHAGIDKDNNLKGFVILTEPLTVEDEWNLPRNSFEECIDAIIQDCDEAIRLLPDEYIDTGDGEVRDAVFGKQNVNRINANILRAFKTRVALWAASPAFNLANSTALWQQAADLAGDFLSDRGGLGILSATGHVFYRNQDDPDIIWRRNWGLNNFREKQQYPPSLFGNGIINPTQNLVDAFPMKNGYPIDDTASGYDSNNPYSGRDPRLEEYIIYNGNDMNGRSINTSLNDANDGLGQNPEATITGYYLKKLLIETLDISPNINNTASHWDTYLRYTEVFLNYAEAMNEANGPDNSGTYGFSAREVLQAIRERGGIDQPDLYLASLDQNGFREMVRNERRIELSFEGFRFWDIRRWKYDLSKLNEPAQGISINGSDYTIFDVEARNYKSFMIYGPIPQQEILTTSKIIQNQGW